MATPALNLPLPPTRPGDAHKGTFGRVLIVAGSRGMTGAAALAGQGALRGGAGLVYVAVPESCVPIVAGIEPSYLTIPLPESSTGRLGRGAADCVNNAAPGMTAVAVGPGLGSSRGVEQAVLSLYRELPQSLVVDADGLNVLARRRGSLAGPAGPRILTPHPGEFARLTGRETSEVQQHRADLAREFAGAFGVVLVLKGAGTIITDGERLHVNPSGNSGLATGGTGDVLTGLLTALLAQGMSPLEAAQLAVWMHGRAGDLAAAELSQPGLIASDLPRYLGRVWRELGR